MVSLDGFIAGPNGELNWHTVDEEFNKYAGQILNSADIILFGRITFEMMADYWPKVDAIKNDPIIAGKMNGLQKIVFSNTLKEVGWNNTTLVKKNLAGEVSKLKEQAGKDILILGSGSIVAQLTGMNLIDDFRFIINPVILGGGKPQFNKKLNPQKLKLIDMRHLNTGVTILC